MIIIVLYNLVLMQVVLIIYRYSTVYSHLVFTSIFNTPTVLYYCIWLEYLTILTTAFYNLMSCSLEIKTKCTFIYLISTCLFIFTKANVALSYLLFFQVASQTRIITPHCSYRIHFTSTYKNPQHFTWLIIQKMNFEDILSSYILWVILLLLCLYYWLTRDFGRFEAKGLISVRPVPFFGNQWGLYAGKHNIADEFIQYYEKTKNQRWDNYKYRWNSDYVRISPLSNLYFISKLTRSLVET